jgi:hypothetical protein
MSKSDRLMNDGVASENLFEIPNLPVDKPFINVMPRNPQEERKLLNTSDSWSSDDGEETKENVESGVRIGQLSDTNSRNFHQRAELLGLMSDSTNSISPPNLMAPMEEMHDLFHLQRLMNPSITSSDSSDTISSDIIGGRRNSVELNVPNYPKTNYNQITKEDVKKILTCHICFGYMSAGNNAMCIYWSKTYCKACLTRSLSSTRKCPNWRKSLRKSQIKRNLIIEDIITTQNRKLEEIVIDKNEAKCEEHNETVSMNCIDCSKYICTECISGDIHLGHKLRSLKHVFNQAKDKAIEESKNLDQYLEDLENDEVKLKQTKQHKVEVVTKSVNNIKSFLNTLLDEHQTRIDS